MFVSVAQPTIPQIQILTIIVPFARSFHPPPPLQLNSLTVVGGGDGPVFLTKERVQDALSNLTSAPTADGVYEWCQRDQTTGGWIVARRGGGRDAVGFFDRVFFKNVGEVSEAWERILETLLGGVII